MDSEQPGTPDSRSMEDRVADALFGPDEAEPPQVTDESQDYESDDVASDDEQPEARDAAPSEGSSEVDEINFLGKSYKVPKELAEAFRERDAYTRKSQEVAERARVWEAHEQANQQRQEFEKATSEHRTKMDEVRQELAWLKRMDWSQFSDEQFRSAVQQRDNLTEQLRQMEGALHEASQRFGQIQEGQQQQAVQIGVQYLQRTVDGGWSADKAQRAMQQGIAEGFTEDQLKSISTMRNPLAPLIVKLLDKSARYDELQSKAKTTLERAKGAPPVVKPGASDPQVSERMRTLNFRKQLSTAKTPAQKNALILSRLEKKFG